MAKSTLTRPSAHPCVSSCGPSDESSSCTLCRSPRRRTGAPCVVSNCRRSLVGRWAMRTHCAGRSAQQSCCWGLLQAACGTPWEHTCTFFDEETRMNSESVISDGLDIMPLRNHCYLGTILRRLQAVRAADSKYKQTNHQKFNRITKSSSLILPERRAKQQTVNLHGGILYPLQGQ